MINGNNKFFLFLILSFLINIPAKSQDTLKIEKQGFIPADSLFKLVYVPFKVPKGVTEIRVEEIYNEMEDTKKNVLNLGIFDQRGYAIGNPLGFRGWSGGAKKSFFINQREASTGYVSGEILEGTWNILIYPSTIIESGIHWKLNIKLVYGKRFPEPKKKPAIEFLNNKPGWYTGDLHMHTFHSDGQRTEQGLIEEAIAKKLDFIISTEHNTNSANLNWGLYDSKNLLVINGEEVTTTEFGHWNAIGLKSDTYIDWRYTPQENQIEKMVYKVHSNKGLAIINHPFYHPKMINSFKYDPSLFDGIEVWNGEWDNVKDNLALTWWDEQLRLGKRMIGIGASDSHKPSGSKNNLGFPETVVYARGLSKDAIIEGIKNGRLYLRASNKFIVDFTAKSSISNAMMGDTLLIEDKAPIFNIKSNGFESGSVILVSNLGTTKTIKISKEDFIFNWELNDHKITYIRLEFRNEDGNILALTNPIFLKYKKPS